MAGSIRSNRRVRHERDTVFISAIVLSYTTWVRPRLFHRPPSPWEQTIWMDGGASGGVQECPRLCQETKLKMEFSTIRDLLERIIALADVVKTQHISSPQLIYEISVARTLLLSQVELILCSSELEESEKTSGQEWVMEVCRLYKAIHLYNCKVVPLVKWAWHGYHVMRQPATHATIVTLADICDVLVTSRSRIVSRKLLEAFELGTMRECFRLFCSQEENMLWVVIAALAKHTSLLKQKTHIHIKHPQQKATASLESVASIARGYWTEHKHLVVALEGRVWKEVSVHLRSVSGHPLRRQEGLEKELQQLANGESTWFGGRGCSVFNDFFHDGT